jgi:hypothetical protein
MHFYIYLHFYSSRKQKNEPYYYAYILKKREPSWVQKNKCFGHVEKNIFFSISHTEETFLPFFVGKTKTFFALFIGC